MPWALLGLDPATATEREVKRAYARLLKVTRPDKDPEGFQKLREAYQTALIELRFGAAEREAIEDASEEENRAQPQPEAGDEALDAAGVPVAEDGEVDRLAGRAVAGGEQLPEAFATALARLEGELAAGGLDHRKVEEATRELERVLYAHPEHAGTWGWEVARLIHSEQGEPRVRLKPEAILFELEHDGSAATEAVIARIEERGTREQVASLAELLRKNRSRISNTAGGQAFARLARAAAIRNHVLLCPPLADAAYELLPPAWRDPAMRAIEHDQRIATILGGLPQRWRPFWLARLRAPYQPWNWADEESTAALEFIRVQQARTWTGFDAIASILPPELAGQVPKYRPPQVSPTPVRREMAGRTSGGGGSRGGGSRWGLFVLFFLGVKVAVLASRCDSTSAGSRAYRPPQVERLDASTLQRLKLEPDGRFTPEGSDESMSLEEVLEKYRQPDETGTLPPHLREFVSPPLEGEAGRPVFPTDLSPPVGTGGGGGMDERDR